MLGSKVHPGPTAWNYRISANLLGIVERGSERAQHLEVHLQGENNSRGATLRVWPNAIQSLSLHELASFLRVEAGTLKLIQVLPNVPVISLGLLQTTGAPHGLEIVVLKPTNGHEVVSNQSRNDGHNIVLTDGTAPNAHAAGTTTIAYFLEIPPSDASLEGHTNHTSGGRSRQRLALIGLQPTETITHTEHLLKHIDAGDYFWEFNTIELPSVRAANGMFCLPETHFQLTHHQDRHPHLPATLSSDCLCLHKNGLLRLQLKIQAQTFTHTAMSVQDPPHKIEQLEIIQGQGQLEFTQALGPWPHLTVTARVMPKKGLLLGPFPTIVTPNLAPTLNVVAALQALPSHQLPLEGLAPLTAHKQHTQLRVIAHANLWIQASVNRPLLVRTLLHFCLGSTPLFSVPLAFRPNDDALDLNHVHSSETLTEAFTHLIEQEHALVAQKIVQDRYALACFLVMFTDVLSKLNDLPRQSLQANMLGQAKGWSVFWQALHRLATFQSTTQHPGSVSHSNKMLHDQLNQITLIFCRNATQKERPTGNKIPLATQFFPTIPLANAGVFDTEPNKMIAPRAPQIVSGRWEQHTQQLHLNLSDPASLKWVRHYRINIIRRNEGQDDNHLINCQCYLPMLLGQMTSGRLSITLPKLWDDINLITIQLLTYGDPAVYETPAVSEFHGLTEDDAIPQDPNPTSPALPASALAMAKQSVLRPWVAHLSSEQIRLKWQTQQRHFYSVEIQDDRHQSVLSVQLDSHTAASGLTLDRKTFSGTFPYQLWVSITPMDLERPQQLLATENTAQDSDPKKQYFEPVFVSIPTLTVFRNIVEGQCRGCYWEKPRYPVSYYQAELFEIQNNLKSNQHATETTLALPCFQTQLPADADKIIFDEIEPILKRNATYEFRLRAKLPDDAGGLFAWTPATVVSIKRLGRAKPAHP